METVKEPLKEGKHGLIHTSDPWVSIAVVGFFGVFLLASIYSLFTGGIGTFRLGMPLFRRPPISVVHRVRPIPGHHRPGPRPHLHIRPPHPPHRRPHQLEHDLNSQHGAAITEKVLNAVNV